MRQSGWESRAGERADWSSVGMVVVIWKEQIGGPQEVNLDQGNPDRNVGANSSAGAE